MSSKHKYKYFSNDKQVFILWYMDCVFTWFYGLDNSNKQSEGKINNWRKIFSSNSKQNICQNKYIEDLTPIQGTS